jgi:hypothetical protein
MNNILEKYFIDTYPKIFVEMYGPVNKTCMHWGITCGDGWFHILDVLCHKIQNRIDSYEEISEGGNVGCIPQVIAKQIKEKLGTLCFYYEGGDNVINGYIAMAQSMSSITCEDCGVCNQDVGHTTSWIRVLCPKCAKEYMSQKFRENEKFIQNKIKLDLFKKIKKSNKRKK